MSFGMGTSWDDESKIAELRVLWNLPVRLPISEIAKRLNVSAAAVTSKARRIGLSARESPIVRMPKLTDTLPLIVGRRGPIARTTLATLESVAGVILGPAPVTALRAIPGRVGECCWPVTNGRPWLFCEAATVPGNRYCEKHREWSMHGSKGSAAGETGAVLPTAIPAAATGSIPGESPDTAPTISNASESSYVKHAEVITSDENPGELGTFIC